MADDDKDAATGQTTPVEPSVAAEHPAPEPSKGTADERLEAPTPIRPHSEWTASDRRGPLEPAGGEVERFVPAHETDAEGGLDTSGSTPHEAPAARSEPSSAEASSAAPTPIPQDRRRSLVPVAAGIVVGAIIGAGSAWLVYSQGYSDDGDAQKIAALSSRLDALDKKPDPQPALGKLQGDVGDLQRKIAAAGQPAPASPTAASKGAAAAPAPADPALAAKVAALAVAVDALKTRPATTPADTATAGKVAALQSGLADVQKQAQGAQSGLDGLKSDQTGLKSEQKALGDKVAALSASVADAQKQAQGAQSGVAGFAERQKALEGKLGSPALAVVADSLVLQIASGQPFARQVDALASLGADPAKVAVLRENAAQGVPSAQALLSSWKPLEEPVIATGNKAPADANFGQRLQHGLFGLVSVRRADGTVGDDLASRVDLIAADLAAGDASGASAAWQALPADAKTKSASWGAQAKTAAEALAAARDLQHQAIDALGTKKS